MNDATQNESHPTWAALIQALNDLRDSLVQGSLCLQDFQFDNDPELRAKTLQGLQDLLNKTQLDADKLKKSP
jgi:hypothetical protein